jgi:hypothetical protein
MQSKLKRNVAIGTTVLAAAAFAGGAYAAGQSSSSNPRQAFLNDVAKRLQVTPAQLNSALKGASLDQLNAAVAAGKLTQAQANAIRKHLQQGGALPRFGFGFGFAHRPDFAGGGQLTAAASYLGLTRAQLMSQLQSGKTLAQIAKAQGKSTSGLKDALLAAIRTKLDKAVTNKQVTQAQEQQILSTLSSHLDDLINGKLPRFPFFHGGAGGPGGPGFIPGGPGGAGGPGFIPGGPGGAGGQGASGWPGGRAVHPGLELVPPTASPSA